MPRHSKTNKRQMKGGDGAADHAIKVFGAAGAQHSAIGSNVIAMKEIVGGKLPDLSPAPVKGGKKNKNGGNVLSDIALPVTLIYANQTFGRKGTTVSKKYSKKFSRKNRKSRSSRRYRK